MSQEYLDFEYLLLNLKPKLKRYVQHLMTKLIYTMKLNAYKRKAMN